MKDFGIDQLDIDDRVLLAHEIWESVRVEIENAPLTDAQRAELERRLKKYELSPNDVIPWEQVYDDAVKRSRK